MNYPRKGFINDKHISYDKERYKENTKYVHTFSYQFSEKKIGNEPFSNKHGTKHVWVMRTYE